MIDWDRYSTSLVECSFGACILQLYRAILDFPYLKPGSHLATYAFQHAIQISTQQKH